MGINTRYYKILAMVISAVICSIAGSFQAVFASMVSPEVFHSVKDIAGLPFDPWMILYGFLRVFMMRFRPQGI